MPEGQEIPHQQPVQGEGQPNSQESRNLSLRERTTNFFMNRLARLKYFGTVTGASAGLGVAALSGNVYPALGLTAFGVVLDIYKNKQIALAEGKIDAFGQKIN